MSEWLRGHLAWQEAWLRYTEACEAFLAYQRNTGHGFEDARVRELEAEAVEARRKFDALGPHPLGVEAGL